MDNGDLYLSQLIAQVFDGSRSDDLAVCILRSTLGHERFNSLLP